MIGSPILYYGDEIGMGDNIWLKDRDGVRTPMQWSDAPQAGFSTAENPCQPVIDDATYGYPRVNVASQEQDKGSLLNAMRAMIALRKKNRAFGRGSIRFVDLGNEAVLAYERAYEGEKILVVNNLAPSSQPVHFAAYRGKAGWDILNSREFNFPPRAQLEASEFLWLLLTEPIS
jgi:maltose alpha-D-glucosyltransferase/alpha-amylase